MTYQSVFGGTTLYPSDVSLLHIHFEVIHADVQLDWPLEKNGTPYPAARIIEAHPDTDGRRVILPAANLAGVGETMLFNNFNSLYSFQVVDFLGGIVATIPPGTCWQVYLAHNDTPQGQWFSFQFGASTATVQPSALAGYGLTVTNTTLSVAVPVVNFSADDVVAASNRASAFVWQGGGSGTLGMLTAASAGNNFIYHVRNQGGGSLTIDPAGGETINGAANLILHPGDSASVFTDGVNWYTVGLGQDPVFAFDYTSITLTGGEHVLAGSELDRIAYKFVGTLTSDATVVVPETIQQYWITNATTGPFRLFIKTASGTPTQVNQGAKGIYYCDGVSIILASDPLTITTPINISDGGTGATTGDAALLNLGVSTLMLPAIKATDPASVRATLGAAKAGVNADITSMTALSAITAPTLALNVVLTVSGDTTLNGVLGVSGQINAASKIEVRNAGPIIALRDTDAPVAFMHCNGGTFYVLRGAADADTWTQVGGVWPLQINLNDNNATFGNNVTAVQFNGSGAGLNGTASSLRAGVANYADNAGHASSADSATNAGHASSADSATNASRAADATNVNGGTIYNEVLGGGIQWNNTNIANTGQAAFVQNSGVFGVYDGTRGNWMIRAPCGGTVTLGEAGGGVSVAGDLTASGNVGAYSDRRLKADLNRIEGALDKVQELTGYTYQRIDLGFAQAGLIAQDVQKVMPVAVSEGNGGMLAINHGALFGLLVEAIKELREEVAMLKDRIA